MPSVIDSLVVTLGLDAKQYKQGSQQARDDLKKTREAAKQTAVDMEARGKQAALFFSKLRNEALMFVGVIAGGFGLTNLTRRVVDTGTSLGRMSTNLNMSVRDLRAWELAARNAGGSAAGIDAQLKESQKAVAMARRGFMPEGAQEFYLQGGTDIRRFKSGEDYLRARLAIVERIERTQGIAAARLSASRMGLDDSQFSFFRLGASGVSASVDQFRKLAGYTKEDTKNAITLTQKFDILRDKFELVGIRIGTALIPYLDKIVGWLTKLADWVNSHQDTIKTWIDKAIGAMKSLWKEVENVVKSLGGWKTVLIALGALKVLSWVGPFNALATALLAVGGALKLISGAGPLAVAAIGAAGAVAVGYALYNPLPENVENDNAIKGLKSVPKGAVMDRAIAFVEMLQKRGMSREHAQGVVGNLLRESSMNPGASMMLNGKSYVGLAQWGPERQALFKKLYGRDLLGAPASMQADFLMWELSHTEKSAGDALRRSPNNQVAARVFQTDYERSQNAAADLPKSQGYAAAVHNAMLNRPDIANGPILPINTMNTLNAATGRYTSSPIPSSNTEVNLNGPITIHTQATDAKGVAASLGDYIKSNILATQANTGLQ